MERLTFMLPLTKMRDVHKSVGLVQEFSER